MKATEGAALVSGELCWHWVSLQSTSVEWMNANTCSECGDVCCRNIPLRTADTDTGEGGGGLLEASTRPGSGNNEQRCPVWCLGQIRGGGWGWGRRQVSEGRTPTVQGFALSHQEEAGVSEETPRGPGLETRADPPSSGVSGSPRPAACFQSPAAAMPRGPLPSWPAPAAPTAPPRRSHASASCPGSEPRGSLFPPREPSSALPLLVLVLYYRH